MELHQLQCVARGFDVKEKFVFCEIAENEVGCFKCIGICAKVNYISIEPTNYQKRPYYNAAMDFACCLLNDVGRLPAKWKNCRFRNLEKGLLYQCEVILRAFELVVLTNRMTTFSEKVRSNKPCQFYNFFTEMISYCVHNANDTVQGRFAVGHEQWIS